MPGTARGSDTTESAAKPPVAAAMTAAPASAQIELLEMIILPRDQHDLPGIAAHRVASSQLAAKAQRRATAGAES